MKKLLLGLVILSLVLSVFVGFNSVSFAQKKYKEAPMLAELVKAGKLPPVEERLPKRPKVMNVWKEIGQYGGTIRIAHIGWSCGLWQANREPLMETYPYFTDKVSPNILEKLDMSKDGKVFTFHLREGMKWSDGEPVTTEDVRFTWEDVILNKDITPYFPAWLTVEGGKPTLEIVDKYTFVLKFPSPYGSFPLVLHGYDQHATFLLPSHYLKKFHVKYTSLQELQPLIKKEGYEPNEWWKLFNKKVDGTIVWNIQTADIGAPTLSPWVVKERPSVNVVILERNPYYWKVDKAGNQLPYIDRIRMEQVTDAKMITTKIISGEENLDRINTSLTELALYKQYEKEKGYRVVIMDSEVDTWVQYFPNLTCKDPVLRKILNDVRFRQALSLAINRDEINKTIFLGLGKPGQASLRKGSRYGKDSDDEVFIEYNPDKANKLLDEMGLDKRDKDGFRLRPDGKRLTLPIEYFEVNRYVGPVTEMVVQYWRAIGIEATMKLIDSTLWYQRYAANETVMSVWHACHATDDVFPVNPFWFVPYTSPSWAPAWQQWYTSGGKEGEEPPKEIKELYKWYKIMITTTDPAQRIKAGQYITRTQAKNLYRIGVGSCPSVAIVGANMGNVPDDPSVPSLWLTWNAEQLFFRQK
jgi:peptide/nickel transport system substrate-binding protein